MKGRRVALWALRILSVGLIAAAVTMTASLVPMLRGGSECGERELGDSLTPLGCAAESVAWAALALTWIGIAPIALAGAATLWGDIRILGAAFLGLLAGAVSTAVPLLIEFSRWEQLLPPAAFATLLVLLWAARRRENPPSNPFGGSPHAPMMG